MRTASFVTALCAIACAGRADAQLSDVTIPPPPRVEFAAGITMQTPRDVNLPPLCEELALPCSSPRTFPDFGLSAQLALSLDDWLALAGEVGVFGNQWRADASASGQRTNLVRFALAGARLQSRNIRRPSWNYALRFFGQVLAGYQASTEVPGGSAIQTGLGLDTWFSNGLGVRVQWDHRFVRKEPRDLSGGRVLVGVVIGDKMLGGASP
jgi:hypothetical protein